MASTSSSDPSANAALDKPSPDINKLDKPSPDIKKQRRRRLGERQTDNFSGSSSPGKGPVPNRNKQRRLVERLTVTDVLSNKPPATSPSPALTPSSSTTPPLADLADAHAKGA
jgi:hypothetical protein